MGKTRGLIALLAIGGFMVASQAKAVDIPVATLKFIAIDKETAAGKSKTVYVSKDAGATKTGDNDVANIAVTLDAQYVGNLGSATMKFEVPAGESDGTSGWLVNKDAVAKYVNKLAPGGPTGAKVVVIKPGLLLKLIGKTRGDSAVMDLIAADEPSGNVYTAYTVTEASQTNVHCSQFAPAACSYKIIGGGTGRKLVCKNGTGDAACTAAGPAPTPAVLEFITGTPDLGTASGSAKNGGSGGTVVKALGIGGLNIGGGCSQGGGSCGVAEGPTPGGAATTFNASCSGTSCTVTARTAAESGSSQNCSAAGCSFGTFLPIANGGTSTCVRNVFSAGGTGTLDLTTGEFDGSVPLDSNVTLTGNGSDPCPRCLGGTPGVTNSGNCDPSWEDSSMNPSPTDNDPCTPTDSAGSTYDCVPEGLDLGALDVPLDPISTGTESADSGGTGIFCPGQDLTEPGSAGCFDTGGGATLCDYIEETGVHAAGISIGGGPVATRLASVFCIPAVPGVFGGLINGAADLPGPGATSLPGTLELIP